MLRALIGILGCRNMLDAIMMGSLFKNDMIWKKFMWTNTIRRWLCFFLLVGVKVYFGKMSFMRMRMISLGYYWGWMAGKCAGRFPLSMAKDLCSQVPLLCHCIILALHIPSTSDLLSPWALCILNLFLWLKSVLLKLINFLISYPRKELGI